MKLVRQTRVGFGEDPEKVKEWLTWGAGPRACQFLVLGAKARAAIQGRQHVTTADIQAVAHPVLRHRVITNFNAEAEGITPDAIVDRLIEETPVEEGAIGPDGAFAQVLRS
jgi:MoxR-like ATPase